MGTTSIHVTPEVRSLFADLVIQGQGGFQRFCRKIAERLTASSTLRLSDEELRQLSKYATHYGEGGFQRRLRLLLALWVDQHLNQLQMSA